MFNKGTSPEQSTDDLGEMTPDDVEQRLIAAEAKISRLRQEQLGLLHLADIAQVATADGAHSLQEWAAGRLDISPELARDLVVATRSVTPALNEQLAASEVSFDRAVATALLANAGASDELIEASSGYDISGIRRMVARHKAIAPMDERQIFDSQTFVIQPSLDEGHYRLFGILAGFEGRTVAKAIQDRADELRSVLDEPQLPSDHRRALALATICQDSLEGFNTGGGSRTPIVTVSVDAALAAASGGERGAELVGGPRIGPAALDELLCTGQIEWNLLEEDGNIVALGQTTSEISPRLLRAVLARDGACTIDACQSTYRPEVHHVIHRADGGPNTADNLATVCWWHHIVAIHRMRMTIDPNSPPNRRRLLRRCDGPD